MHPLSIPRATGILTLSAVLALPQLLSAQQTADPSPRPQNAPARRGEPPPQPGQGPGRGRGGGMGGVQQDLKLIPQFDKNGDKRLDLAERTAAREFLTKERAEGRGPRRPGPRGRGEPPPTPVPGVKLSPAQVQTFPNAPLYDPSVVRTFFLDFESPQWEAELSDFYRTDVEVPAKLTVDGQTYEDAGVHFRGASSFFTVAAGQKRSLNLSLDWAKEDQRLGGFRTLNLLNAHTDPTFLRTILYLQAARSYLPAPKANYVRLVLNGESWGIYVNAQQFNSDFTKEWFGSAKGARWKVPGSPRGQGGLNYLGEDPEPYKRVYELKTKDNPQVWKDLIQLCRILEQTPPAQLEAALNPILDIDGALKFLALENALINSDGYWIRSSDYHIYQDEKGKFHLIPHDANETFRAGGGPGGGGGGRGGASVELDPFTGANDPNKPLLHRLLAAPALRSRYASYIRDIANQWLDWEKLGPIARSHQSLIADDVKADTRKLYSVEAFSSGLADAAEEAPASDGRRAMSLKTFADQRRAFLLNHPEIKVPATPP